MRIGRTASLVLCESRFFFIFLHFGGRSTFPFGTGDYPRNCVRVRVRFPRPPAGRPRILLMEPAARPGILLSPTVLHISFTFFPYFFIFPSYFVMFPPYFFIFPEALPPPHIGFGTWKNSELTPLPQYEPWDL